MLWREHSDDEVAKVVMLSGIFLLLFAGKVRFKWDLKVEEERSSPILSAVSLTYWRVKIINIVYYCITNLQVLFSIRL